MGVRSHHAAQGLHALGIHEGQNPEDEGAVLGRLQALSMSKSLPSVQLCHHSWQRQARHHQRNHSHSTAYPKMEVVIGIRVFAGGNYDNIMNTSLVSARAAFTTHATNF
jgi:hypothetical protein